MIAAEHARRHDPDFAMRDDAAAAELLRRIRARVGAEVKRLQRELAPVEEEPRRSGAGQRTRIGSRTGEAVVVPGNSPEAAVRARLTRMKAIERALDGVVPGDLRGEWAGPGSIVVLEDAAGGEREEFLLMPGDVEHLGSGYMSLSSPIGQAVAGRGTGATVAAVLPDGVRTLRIVALRTLCALVGVDASDLERRPALAAAPK